ncbi:MULTISPECIES: hypothetical protein [Sphingomonas]|uniref:Antitoxin n=1 Tax=Sphingomonas kyungheensis TaxID=1069987 RepID=A0ABU8H6T8_9SPHN|nr:MULTISPECIES: hypothetical protein [unclassified Sphingomonas]
MIAQAHVERLRSCYDAPMLKTRSKRLAANSATAVQSLAEIEEAIATLGNEDLLDLADIFREKPTTSLARLAAAEMTRRGISL